MTPYIAAVLRRELDALRAAPEGGRNCALFRAAAALGSLVGSGALDEDALREELLDAAELPRREALGVLRRGLRRGIQRPRVLSSFRSGFVSDGRPVPPQEPPPRRPPRAQLEAAWETAVPVTQDPEAVAWCRSRRLDPVALEDWEAARVLRPDFRGWHWTRLGARTWNEAGFRLLLRLFDAAGRFVSLRARKVRGGDGPKELAPLDFETRGLFLADPLALQVLRDGPPPWWSARDFVVCEGSPDWMSGVALQPDADEGGPAVLGLAEGSWTAALADRIPDGANVFIRDHADATGEAHVERITRDLGSRCNIYRIERKENEIGG